MRHICEWSGLAYEDETKTVRVTELGRAVLRWTRAPSPGAAPLINEGNALILGRHAAYALAACQLRNPTGAGEKYHPSMVVFPFAFIWRVMLASEGRLNSDELNRAVLRIRDESGIGECVERIAASRAASDVSLLGDSTLTGRTNDRLIAWMSLASFGWVLLRKKDRSGFYTIRPGAEEILRSAASIGYAHLEHATNAEFVAYLSSRAALPQEPR